VGAEARFAPQRLTLEIFGSLTRLISDTDELYRAHVHTVMLGMGFDPDLTSTTTAHRATRATSPWTPTPSSSWRSAPRSSPQ
jgi:hypothetical protein